MSYDPSGRRKPKPSCLSCLVDGAEEVAARDRWWRSTSGGMTPPRRSGGRRGALGGFGGWAADTGTQGSYAAAAVAPPQLPECDIRSNAPMIICRYASSSSSSEGDDAPERGTLGCGLGGSKIAARGRFVREAESGRAGAGAASEGRGVALLSSLSAAASCLADSLRAVRRLAVKSEKSFVYQLELENPPGGLRTRAGRAVRNAWV